MNMVRHDLHGFNYDSEFLGFLEEKLFQSNINSIGQHAPAVFRAPNKVVSDIKDTVS